MSYLYLHLRSMLKQHQMLIFIPISAQMYGLLSDVPEECDEVQKCSLNILHNSMKRWGKNKFEFHENP